VKTYNQNTKYNPQDPIYPAQTRHPGALIQCQPVGSSFHTINGFKLLTLVSALALGLIAKPYLAHAEENAVMSTIHALADLYAQETGDVLAQDHWTRIEFSGTYIDPVLIVENSSVNENNSYVVGIRNVDAMGFEIRQQFSWGVCLTTAASNTTTSYNLHGTSYGAQPFLSKKLISTATYS
jgi:hypothetical protein